jgi:hypothetical protein
MIGWGQIGYGAVLSAVAAAVVVALVRPRRIVTIAGAAVAAAAGPVAWNAILHATHASTFFTDAPVAGLPASWQDTGSGVFAVAIAALLLGFGTDRRAPARRTATVALLAGVAAFLVDVYLYRPCGCRCQRGGEGGDRPRRWGGCSPGRGCGRPGTGSPR